ncbi:MAG: hypothetical protein J3K34DRAFT_526527, partial [Monoraphidium minutum]
MAARECGPGGRDPCSADAGDDAPCCWICLGGSGGADSGTDSGVGGALERPCACPRAVHGACLGRWQLQQAGRPEERACRFCGGDYGDWRPRLSAKAHGGGGGQAAPLEALVAVMAVQAGGRLHKLEARAGPAGKAAFAAE